MAIEASPAAIELLRNYPSVDVHSHAGATGTLTDELPSDDLATAMRAGSLAATVLAECPDWPILRRTASGALGGAEPPPRGELYQTHLRRREWVDALVADHGLRRALTAADVTAAHAAGTPALIHAIEGLDFLEGDLGRIEDAGRTGVRVVQLVHYTPNDLGDYQTGEVVHGGLTELGAQAVRDCNRLGLVVDVAHGSEEMVRGAARVTTAPLLLSHTALAESSAMDPTRLPGRRVTPVHARLVADTGGTIGVWHFFSSLEAYVEGIRELVAVVGVDHVSVGTDQQVNAGIMQDYGDLGRLVDLLLQSGFSEVDVAKLIGGNFLRVFAAATGEASA